MSDYLNYQYGVQMTSDLAGDVEQLIANHYTNAMNNAIINELNSLYQTQVYAKDVADYNHNAQNIANQRSAIDNSIGNATSQRDGLNNSLNNIPPTTPPSKDDLQKQYDSDGSLWKSFLDDEQKKIDSVMNSDMSGADKATLVSGYGKTTLTAYDDKLKSLWEEDNPNRDSDNERRKSLESTIDALNDKIKRLEEERGMLDVQEKNLTPPDNQILRLTFDDKRDLQKFVFDMDAKGVNLCAVANKLNGQYCVVTSRSHYNEIAQYSANNNMAIREFDKEKTSNIAVVGSMKYEEYQKNPHQETLGGAIANDLRQPFMFNVYESEAGQGQRSLHRLASFMRVAHNAYNDFKAPTTRDLRTMAWDDMENAVASINAGLTPLTDQKYGSGNGAWTTGKNGKPAMTTKDMLTSINATTGAKLGIDIFKSKHVKEDALKLRTELIKKYSGIVLVDKKGNINVTALRDLQNGKSKFSVGTQKPSEAEINFLLMTAQGSNKSGFSTFVHGMRGMISRRIMYSNGMTRDIQKLIDRSRQMMKICKSAQKYIAKDVRRHITAINLRRAAKNPAKQADKLKKQAVKNQAKGVKRAGKGNSLLSKRQQRIQNHRIKKMEKRDRRNQRKKDRADRRHAIWMATPFGKLGAWWKARKSALASKLSASPLGRMFSSIKGGIGKFLDFKNFLKKKLMILGGTTLGAGMVIIVVCLMFSAIISAILSFFGEPDVEDTIMYKLYERLEEEEEDWIETGTDMKHLYDNRTSLKYGSMDEENPLDFDDYIERINNSTGDLTIFTDKEKLTEDVDKESRLYINPFGFELSNRYKENDFDMDTVVKEITEYDGTESSWQIAPYGASDHTKNIKDILCMTDVMFKFDAGQASDSWMAQSMSDSWITFGFKGFCNNVCNFFKRIGSWFSDEEYDESKEDETKDYGTLKGYCIGLYEASHQESIELLPLILPVKNSEENTSTPRGYCPVVHGCTEGEHFSVNDSGQYVLYDSNEGEHVCPNVYLTESQKEDLCVKSTWASDKKTWDEVTGSDCWKKNEDEDKTYDWKTTTTETMGSYKGDWSEVTVTYSYSPNEMTKTEKRSRSTWDEEEQEVELPLPEDAEEGAEPETETRTVEVSRATEYQERKTTYKRECNMCHSGRFCGGHVSCKVNGRVYSLPSYIVGYDDVIPEPKVQPIDKSLDFHSAMLKSGENLSIDKDGNWSTDHFGTDKEKTDFVNSLPTCNDIFDISLNLRYGQSVFPIHNRWQEYESWTGDNIQIVATKFNQNWSNVYKFDIDDNIGATRLTGKDINNIIESVKERYYQSHFKPLDEERIDAITRALQCVGRGSYSMEHHEHAYLYEPCPKTGYSCRTTDCSGFVSYIFLESGKLDRVCATDGLVSGAKRFTDWRAVEPADALIHWSGQTSSQALENGGAGSHALIYIGHLWEDVTLESGRVLHTDNPLTVDCLSLYSYSGTVSDYVDDDGEIYERVRHGGYYDCGAGNIYLRHAGDDIYRSSSYITNPDSMLYVRKFK